MQNQQSSYGSVFLHEKGTIRLNLLHTAYQFLEKKKHTAYLPPPARGREPLQEILPFHSVIPRQPSLAGTTIALDENPSHNTAEETKYCELFKCIQRIIEFRLLSEKDEELNSKINVKKYVS